MTTPVRFTPEQINVISQPDESKSLVVAGAGTGKTHVMTERISKMLLRINEDFSTVLILSFSRAVSQELRKKLHGFSDASKYLKPYTIDSFANTLLSEYIDPDEYGSYGYDTRIQMTTKHLKENPSVVCHIISDLRHIFIDEIQDLNSFRQDFVVNLLNITSSGFTLMGDPAQSIYDFTKKTDSEKTIFSILKSCYNDLQTFTFSDNFRASTPKAKTALWAGGKLRATTPDYKKIYTQLHDQLFQSDDIKKITNLRPLRFVTGKKTAILCRTNPEVLSFSDKLFDLKVMHTIKNRQSERPIPPWIYVLFSEMQIDILAKKNFEGNYKIMESSCEQSKIPYPKEGEAWRMLQVMAKSNNNSIQISNINKSLKSGYIPETTYLQDESNVTISTVHASKGLEYDDVIVSKPVNQNSDNKTKSHLLFVAMTRCSKDLFFTECSDLRRWGYKKTFLDRPYSRWCLRHPNFRSPEILGIEVRVGDIDTSVPPDNWFHLNSNAVPELFKKTKPGDKVMLTLSQDKNNSDEIIYQIIHADTLDCLGLTKPKFGKILRKLLPSNTNMPRNIANLRFVGFQTSAINPTHITFDRKHSEHLWLSPMVVGLGTWD